MRNPEMEGLDGLVGEWRTTISNAWFLEPAGTEIGGSTTIAWWGEAFLLMHTRFDPGRYVHDEMSLVLGRSDPDDAFRALTHDSRGTSREFAMTFADGAWTLSREDPDMHQRFVADVGPDRIHGRWDASEDAGSTWRTDLEITYERVSPTPPTPA